MIIIIVAQAELEFQCFTDESDDESTLNRRDHLFIYLTYLHLFFMNFAKTAKTALRFKPEDLASACRQVSGGQAGLASGRNKIRRGPR